MLSPFLRRAEHQEGTCVETLEIPLSPLATLPLTNPHHPVTSNLAPRPQLIPSLPSKGSTSSSTIPKESQQNANHNSFIL